jgi:hypothetical protein
MAAKRLLMNTIREVPRLKWGAALPNRAVARACGVGVGTVSTYVRRAHAAGLGRPLPEDLDDRALDELPYPRCWMSPSTPTTSLARSGPSRKEQRTGSSAASRSGSYRGESYRGSLSTACRTG